MNRVVRILILPLLILLSGCLKGPTYPKDRVVESVEEVCLKEYNTVVKAKVVGKTLGVYLPLDQLIGSLYGEVSFEEKAQQAIDNVMQTIRRVTLSTDADIEFFTIIGADKSLGIELVTTRYVDDLHRVILLNISLNDFVTRVMYQMGPSPTILGNKRIAYFFKSLGNSNIEKVIEQNFVDNVSLENISPSVFINMLESGMKTKTNFFIQNLKMKPIDSNHILYYVKVKEKYELKENFSADALSVPEDFEYRYLILLSTQNYNALIEKIIPLNTVNKEKEIIEIPIPDEYIDYGEPEEWASNDFFVEDIQLPNFIAFQAAQKIQKFLSEQKELAENVQASFVKEEQLVNRGSLPSRSVFELIFTLKESKQNEENKISKELLKTSLNALENICKNYNFSDYSGIRVLDSQRKEILNIDKSMLPTILGK